jgi:hypothetical protein
MMQDNLSGEGPPPPLPINNSHVEGIDVAKEVTSPIVLPPNSLGTINNPIIYKNHTFINAKITITFNIHVKFINCTFIKCHLDGQYTMKNCTSKDHDENVYKTIHAFKIEPSINGYFSIYGNIAPPKENKYINYIKKYYR